MCNRNRAIRFHFDDIDCYCRRVVPKNSFKHNLCIEQYDANATGEIIHVIKLRRHTKSDWNRVTQAKTL